MIRRPSVEQRDVRGEDSRKPCKLCRQARMLREVRRLRPPCAFRESTSVRWRSTTGSASEAGNRRSLPPHRFGDVPTGVVPYENENLLANGFELSHAPLEKARRYRRNRPPVHEPDPRPIESGQVESVTAYGFRLGIVLGDRPSDEARGLALLGPGVERGQGHPAPPALVQEAHRPLGVGSGDFHQSVAPPFFFRTRGRGRLSTASLASSEPRAGAKASPAPSPPRRALR